MTTTIARRLGKVEATIEARETEGRAEWQMGYCQELPADYVGDKHVVVVSRLPNGYYEWEERPGPRPVGYDADAAIPIRVILEKGRDGVKVPYKLGDAWRELEAGRTQPEVVNRCEGDMKFEAIHWRDLPGWLTEFRGLPWPAGYVTAWPRLQPHDYGPCGCGAGGCGLGA